MEKRLDIDRLLNDLGGPAVVGGVLQSMGGTRTEPYRWRRQANLTGRSMGRLLGAMEKINPKLRIADYFN